MERVLSLTTFDEVQKENPSLTWWLSRPPEERIAEVERLRREYYIALHGALPDGYPARLRRSLLIVEREEL